MRRAALLSIRLKITLTLSCFVVALVAIATLAGVRLNITKSYPPGFYFMTNDTIKKGSLVIFCPTDTPAFREARARGYIGAGFCQGGYGYMIKKILATKGDHVVISAAGVTVNGKFLPNSKPMNADLEGRSLHYIEANIPALDEHSVLLMSDYSAKSFDARYFGLLDKVIIISSIRPIWAWGETPHW
jgi:conjugative transfer signal peptidase TraF